MVVHRYGVLQWVFAFFVYTFIIFFGQLCSCLGESRGPRGTEDAVLCHTLNHTLCFLPFKLLRILFSLLVPGVVIAAVVRENERGHGWLILETVWQPAAVATWSATNMFKGKPAALSRRQFIDAANFVHRDGIIPSCLELPKVWKSSLLKSCGELCLELDAAIIKKHIEDGNMPPLEPTPDNKAPKSVVVRRQSSASTPKQSGDELKQIVSSEPSVPQGSVSTTYAISSDAAAAEPCPQAMPFIESSSLTQDQDLPRLEPAPAGTSTVPDSQAASA